MMVPHKASQINDVRTGGRTDERTNTGFCVSPVLGKPPIILNDVSTHTRHTNDTHTHTLMKHMETARFPPVFFCRQTFGFSCIHVVFVKQTWFCSVEHRFFASKHRFFKANVVFHALMCISKCDPHNKGDGSFF